MMEERFRVEQHMFQSQRKVGHVTYMLASHSFTRAFSGFASAVGAAAGAHDGNETHAAYGGASRHAFLPRLKENPKKRGKVGVQGSH